DETLEVADINGERCFQAELYRLKGELLLKQSSGRTVSRAATNVKDVFEAEPSAAVLAEVCFHQSIDIAQQQKSKSWNLRAAMSLARLYRNQGKQKEARRLLAQIYDKFTEGFDTLDLYKAKALLNELL